MALIVEDGSGLANANSYVTAADADTYFASIGELGWAGDTSFKEQNLINATAAVDATYGPRYISFLRDEVTQSLLWPREQVWDRHSRRIDDGALPTSLINATCEMALLSQNGVNLYPEGRKSNNVTAEAVAVGEISQSFTYQKSPTEQATYEGFRKVEQLLWPILNPTTQRMVFAV
jgi:hypothetical protein